ncbi:Mobile element protein [Candidatus Rhodobacter oscarellae]|uniref:Mobile element protein n=1 Tax=Candidatus Rhodobacter oscarellae TaxID=1675527 RepID=A0A0J9E7Q6_9RHOB|nr:IS30 family transposase [Candidatus Rhodobacter lobularis]KMW58756.1 Mobile element protein [Candidatus Rhodobacter lobularis]
MSKYTQLSPYERDQIADLRAQGLGPTAIDAAIGRDKSTVSRELKRNDHQDGAYRPVYAEGSYRFRRQRGAVLEKDGRLRQFVLDRLAEGWTPEQIAGWLKCGIEIGLSAISTKTIYTVIFRSGQKTQRLWRYLTRRKASRGHRARRSKDKIASKTLISERSQAANDCAEPGHWESDPVICRQNRPLLALHERKTRLTIMTRLVSKTAAETATAITGNLSKIDPGMRRSVTFDNGGEIARHSLLKDALGLADILLRCLCKLAKRRGLVGRFSGHCCAIPCQPRNGRIRRWLPRQTYLDALTEEDIQDVSMTLNLTPRKCLGFRSPAEAFLNELGKSLTIRFNNNVALGV